AVPLWVLGFEACGMTKRVPALPATFNKRMTCAPQTSRALALICVFLLGSWASTSSAESVPAQDSKSSKDFALSVDVNRVALYVTVREGKARFVSDLRREDFVVLEDAVRQEIVEFSRNDVPISIGLVIDNSQSMMNKRKEVLAAAKSFIHASNPDDEMFVVHFNDRIAFGLP